MSKMLKSIFQSRAMTMVLITCAAIAGCAGSPTLQPAPDAAVIDSKGMTATDSAEGVTLTARYGAWNGDVNIESAITTLRVTIENNSPHKLRIRYSDFALVTDRNARYAALPPYDVTGSVSAPAMASAYRPIDRPGFRYDGFSVAPHYYSIYPYLTPYELEALYFDPFYYSHYYPYWDRMRTELPTPDMLRKVVPEGVLDEGGEIEGFLYFEKLVQLRDDQRVNFHVDLVDAINGQRFASLHIPFIVNDPTARN